MSADAKTARNSPNADGVDNYQGDLKMLTYNKNLFPISDFLAGKMVKKIVGYPRMILEPQGGKGDLADKVCEHWRDMHHRPEIMAIEIDENLQAILREKGFKVIDSDFLSFAGPDKFDLIISNPPFDEGDKHLLKAIDILYKGQIICVLNAETLKNPFTNSRKLLVRTLEELGAEIEYYEGAFLDAERTTSVDVALINILVERNVEEDLFAGAKDRAEECKDTVQGENALSTGKTIREMVAHYNQIVAVCTETIVAYYKNYSKVHNYIGLNQEPKSLSGSKDLTSMLQDTVNKTVREVRKNFWRSALELDVVTQRLTKEKREEFEHQLSQQCEMDFTENNVRAFILNIIGGHEKTIMDSVVALFDRFTIESSYRDTVYEKNIHYFNGWKTNDAFKVGERVIIPIYGSYGLPFINWGRWDLNWQAAQVIRDIDLVMNYFDGMRPYCSMVSAIERAFAQGENKAIYSTYFKITAHKKGTLHLTFMDKDILRRFNVAACIGKGWLPDGYGTEPFGKLTAEKQDVVKSFEDEKIYEENLDAPLFPTESRVLKIAA